MTSRFGLPLILAGLVLLAGCSVHGPGLPEGPHEAGIAYMDLATGETLVYNGNALFHAASTMKTPVMFQLFRMRDEGLLNLNDPVLVTNEFSSIVDASLFSLPLHSEEDDRLVPRLNQSVPMIDLIEHMIIYSSNLATNLLIQIAQPEEISKTLEEIGAAGVLVLRGVEDLKAYELGLNNQTSAYGMMKMMEAVYRSDLVADSSRARMIDILKRQHYNSMIPAGLPGDVVVAHKTGSITRIAHDAAIVYPPDSSPYVLVILMRGWNDHAVASRAGARISKAVYALHAGDLEVKDIPIPILLEGEQK